MIPIRRRNSSLRTSPVPVHPKPCQVVVRSPALVARGAAVMVHSMAEFARACPDANPEDAAVVARAFVRRSDAVVNCVPGR
jgi:hypothetical protein